MCIDVYCVCMYVCMYVRTVCTYARMYVCTYVRMYVCTHVCMYVCMYVCFSTNTCNVCVYTDTHPTRACPFACVVARVWHVDMCAGIDMPELARPDKKRLLVARSPRWRWKEHNIEKLRMHAKQDLYSKDFLTE